MWDVDHACAFLSCELCGLFFRKLVLNLHWSDFGASLTKENALDMDIRTKMYP